MNRLYCQQVILFFISAVVIVTFHLLQTLSAYLQLELLVILFCLHQLDLRSQTLEL